MSINIYIPSIATQLYTFCIFSSFCEFFFMVIKLEIVVSRSEFILVKSSVGENDVEGAELIEP